MHTETHRVRFFLVVFVLTLLALLFARPSHGGWSADPVQVSATTASVPLVAVAADGHYGTLVLWQEDDGTNRMLRATHLLASGDPDPAWSAPAAVSNASVVRAALGAVSDGAGGAYVWWMENAALYLTRVTAAGAVAGGWPARGRNLGSLLGGDRRPCVVNDGGDGVYAAWIAPQPLSPTLVSILAVHLGPANTGKAGWGPGAKALGETAAWSEVVESAAIAAAPDGGLWLAFATASFVDQVAAPGDSRLVRLTGSGAPAAGWDAHGISLGEFRGDIVLADPSWRAFPRRGLIAVANDGAAGAYVIRTIVSGEANVAVFEDLAEHHVGGDGLAAPGWPSPGRLLMPLPGGPGVGDAGEAASVRALADGLGGVLFGVPQFYSEGIIELGFTRFGSTAEPLPGGLTTNVQNLDLAVRGDGGMFAAACNPTGPYGPYQPYAFVAADQSDPGAGFFDWSDQIVLTRYGDVGIAATGDGGAVVAWSQYIDRHGLFAIRLSPAGPVTGVPPAPASAAASLRARFVSGRGVLVNAVLPGESNADLTLLDVQGRVLASLKSASRAGDDTLLPGTSALGAGIYFLRARAGAQELRTKLVVVR